MKKILAFLIITIMMFTTSYAASEYEIIDLSEYSKAADFTEGLCGVKDKETGQWGFVDYNKNCVVPFEYRKVGKFNNGLCTVNTMDGKTVLIDHSGKVVIECSEFHENVEEVFVENHGKHKLLWKKGLGNDKFRYRVELLDENFNNITPNNVVLCSIENDDKDSTSINKNLFLDTRNQDVYNYKGVNISSKIEGAENTITNNKYIVKLIGKKIKCYDIDGNNVAEFKDEFAADAVLRGDLIICDKNVYNISENKLVFDKTKRSVENIETYYNKYFTVKENNGTSALYSNSGNMLVDFEHWTYIYPSSISNRMVATFDNYSVIADYNGNLLDTSKYVNHNLENPMRYSGRYAYLQNGADIYYIDMVSLNFFKSSTNIKIGYKYHTHLNQVLDINLNTVYNFKQGEKLLASSLAECVMFQNDVGYNYCLRFKDNGIKVKLDNVRLDFDTAPVIQNGRTLVPMRAIFESMGASVEWDGQTQTITAKKKDVTVEMKIGNDTLIKNDTKSKMDVSPQIIDGRTMVPVRAISDSFSITVDWDSYSQTVLLYTN